MFLTTGSRWKARRRLLTPAFHFQILNSFVDVFNEQSLTCAEVLESTIEETTKKQPIDIFTHMTRLALDIICGKIFIITECISYIYGFFYHKFIRFIYRNFNGPTEKE